LEGPVLIEQLFVCVTETDVVIKKVEYTAATWVVSKWTPHLTING